MDAHRVQRADLVGHSFGGNVATHVAALAPERVASLSLVDPAIAIAPVAGLAGAKRWAAGRTWPSRAAFLAEKRAERPEHARGVADVEAEVHLAAVGADGTVTQRVAAVVAVAAYGEMTRPTVSLAGYPGPVLLIDAAQFPLVHDGLRDALRADVDPHRLTERSVDAGHELLWDAFDETAGALALLLGPVASP